MIIYFSLKLSPESAVYPRQWEIEETEMDAEFESLSGSFGSVSTEFLNQKISKLHPQPPLTVGNHESLKRCIELMQQFRIGSLLVVDKDEKLCGIFSERDVLMKVALHDLDLEKCCIADFMTPDPKSETLDTSVAFVLRAMVEGRFRHVPIVDSDNTPLGIVSVKDILEFIEVEMIKQLAAKELGS